MTQPLTRREREVLQLRADGLTVREVADLLGINRGTVSETSERILVKLEATSFTQAVANAYHNGVFQPVGRKVLQINRAQALGMFKLSQQVPVNDELEILDQDNNGGVHIRAGYRRFHLPRRGGYDELVPETAPEALSNGASIPGTNDPVTGQDSA